MSVRNEKIIVYFILVFIVFPYLNGCNYKNPEPPIPKNQTVPNKADANKINIQENKKNQLSIINESKEQQKKVIKPSEEKKQVILKKEVYLTFDDGPTSNTTRQILSILKENKVKATFFVIGSVAEENPKLLKELSDSRMCIAPHTYSHRYSEIFSSPISYINDLEKCTNVIQNITEKEVIPYTRIPGGMENRYVSREIMSKITTELREKNINYVGWNICSNDAVGKSISAEEVRDNVINQSKRLKNNKALVVLLHDSYYKKSTVEALSSIISFYKSQGYEFKTFDDISEAAYSDLKLHNVVNKEVNKAKIK